jgi:hypothetical protein
MRLASQRAHAAPILLATIALLVWACGSSVPSPTAGIASPTSAITDDGQIVQAVTASPAEMPSQSIISATPFSGESPGGTSGSDGGSQVGPTAAPTPSSHPRLPARTVTIAAAGDIACDPAFNTGQPKDCDQMATAALLGRLHPTAVLTLGDNQYQSGTPAAFAQVYGPSWGQYRSITLPTIGNHEYLTAGAAGYFGYFRGFGAYYSTNLGDWHIISLDSECHYVGGCGVGSAQERWLRADLAANPRLCTLVTYHEPSWSSGQHGDATQMRAIWADLVAAHVDVVLSGHNHDYERFTFLNASGQPDPQGTMEFVVGTGGKNDYAFSGGPIAGEQVRGSGFFGVLSMRLGPSSFSWNYVPAAGFSFSDSGSAGCH